MDNAIYAALTRQSGLMQEMQSIANNMANASTTGFRREGVVFSEYVDALDGEAPALSMAYAHGRSVDLQQGGLTQTGGTYDFAIEGQGFFMVQTPEGNELTRAGSFIPSAEGMLLTPDGYPVLDQGGSPITIPPGQGPAKLSQDGTLSINGAPIAQVGVFLPPEGSQISHVAGTRFKSDAEPEPAEEFSVLQGQLEDSNVDPIAEVSRMIQVQRAYELGQKFLDREDERIRGVISTLSR
ncbi:flagellar hook-basal body complex protein [Paenirhodobacter sp.]|jgi:flagellar basal-body rod protein FlgF|uniref:flagellar hook-basal body complex protein n=1 Tax=Paenirhodobacter sp. TaxID=1965326 RepID=UPI003B51057F